jgi:peptidyl-prolyl cis-trans isomerase C
MNSPSKQVLGFIASSFLVCTAYSQNKPESAPIEKKETQIEFVATVNGAPITQGLLDLNVQAAVNQGQKDTPQLRQAIKEELINRALIAQEAMRQGLDKEIDFRDLYTQLKQSLLLQAFIDNHLKTSPITEAKLLEEYEKQKQAMGGGNTASQYLLSQIVLSTESETIAVISRLQNGEPFAKVAKDVSRDSATKSQGGQAGWVVTSQVATPIADIMINLPKGSFSTTPIKLQGTYVVIKVDDIRSVKLPIFNAAKNQLRQELIQKYLSESIKKLRDGAKVVQ